MIKYKIDVINELSNRGYTPTVIRKNKWIRGLLFFIALFVLLVEIGNGNVQASGKEGSLTIDYHGMTKNNMEIPLVNATFSLYQVGTYENGEYQLETSVQNSNFTTKKLNQLNNMIASKQEEQAKEKLSFMYSSMSSPRFGTPLKQQVVLSGIYVLINSGDTQQSPFSSSGT